MERDLRRCQSILTISGSAVVAFAFWDAAKVVLYCLWRADSIRSYLQIFTDNKFVVAAVFGIIMAVFLGGILSFRLFIGLSAKAEAKGKKKTPVYLILAVIMICLLIGSLLSSVMTGIKKIEKFAEDVSYETEKAESSGASAESEPPGVSGASEKPADSGSQEAAAPEEPPAFDAPVLKTDTGIVVIMDLTSILALADMLRAAHKLRKIRKLMAEKAPGAGPSAA